MKLLYMLAAIVLLILPLGCGTRKSATSLQMENESGLEKAYVAGEPILESKANLKEATVEAGLPEIPAEEPASGGPSESTISRKMTYSASYVLGVYQIWPVMEKLEYLAKKFDGYVQKQTTDTIVLRIPAANFTEARDNIETLGRVMEKSIEANDVTEKYTDLSLRLKMRQAYLQELQGLLEKTTDVKQMLAIQQEIAKTVEEIEVLQGKLNYLANQVAYSTIAVRLVKTYEQKGTRISLPFYWIQTLDLEYLLKRY